MKARRLIVIAVAGLGIVVLLVLGWFAYWEHKQPVFQNASQLMAALRAFTRDQQALGRPLPPTISLRELVAKGYVTRDDVSAFEGIEVTFFTHVDETQPQLIVAAARMPDAQLTCLMADGNVQGFTKAQYEQYLASIGQRVGGTNGSQALRSSAQPSAGVGARGTNLP